MYSVVRDQDGKCAHSGISDLRAARTIVLPAVSVSALQDFLSLFAPSSGRDDSTSTFDTP